LARLPAPRLVPVRWRKWVQQLQGRQLLVVASSPAAPGHPTVQVQNMLR